MAPQDDERHSHKRQKGCFVSHVTCTVLFFCFIIAIAAVGLGAYFGRPPCPKCDITCPEPPSPEQLWEDCKETAAYEKECKCEKPEKPPTKPPPPTPTPRPTGFRLDKAWMPEHYNIQLKPDIYGPTPSLKATGRVQIWVTCARATDTLTLHISKLDINQSSIEFREEGPGGPTVEYNGWEEDKVREFFILRLRANSTAGGAYYFSVQYNASLNHKDLYGFYVNSYLQNGTKRYAATTQFSRTYARRAFPCFDEPGFKATFNVTLIRKPGYTALSNMERIESRSSPGGYAADDFKKSLPMSTYLVAFAVFDFASKSFTTPRGTFMRAWSRPDYVNQLDYSLGISGLLLEAFQDYTGLAQPLSKTDQIAVPSLRPGGMENWGMITYREPYFLYHPQYSSTSDQIALANYISHEISHTFFGNLVTCEWWEDVFLNEGFATYFAVYGLKTIYPTWKMEEEFGRLFLIMLFYDGMSNSQPIHFTGLEHPKDLTKAFSSVTYRKGAAIIRMVNYFLGQDTFQRAMRTYLRRHAYGSVKLQDLFDVLDEQARLDNKVTWDESASNIISILLNWLDQQGYPVVKVTNKGGGNYSVTQELFLMDAGRKPRYPSPYGFKWEIPFTYTSRAQMDQNQSSLAWMHRTDIELTGLDPDFILGNYRRQGYYRVNYDNQSWDRIIQLLNNNHQKIDVFTRAQLVDDSLTFAEMGLLTEVEGLRVTEYLSKETEYLPWYAALRRLTYFNNVFRNTETYEPWQRYMLNLLVTKLYDMVGWDDSDPLEHHEKGIRSTVISRACSMGYGPCRQEARRLYRMWMNNENNNPISPNLRYTVYCEAIRSGGSAEWEFAYKMYQKKYEGYIASEKSTLQKALACSRMPWIVRKYLKMVIGWGSTSRVSSVALNPVGAPLVWDLLMTNSTNWPSRLSKSTILRTLTRTYSTEQDLQKFEAFVSKYPDDKMESTYRSIRSFIKKDMRWLEKNEKPMRAWLNAANQRTGLQPAAMETYDDTYMFAADQDDIFAF